MSTLITLSAVLQGTAALLQLTAAYLALRLIRVTGWTISWLVISGALCIMALRRGYSLWLLLAAGAPPLLPFDEVIAVAISLLMLVGMLTITPFFQALKESEKNQRKTGRILVSQVAASTAQLQTTKEQLETELLERRRAESALAAEHQRVYALLEALPALVYLKAPDYTIRFANRRFREDYGDPEGRHCYEIFGRSEICQTCVSLKVLETRAPLREEWVRPYGERTYEFIHYPFRDLDGSPLVLTLGIDITERKQMEEALRRSEEKYRLLVNQIPAMVFKGYADWSVEFFDDKIETLTGYKKEDFHCRRLKWCDVILPEDLDYATKVFLDALKSDGSYVREHRVLRKDGEIRWVQCWGQIFLDHAGKIDYISGVTFD
ncbi:MAG: PAS domain-containing protein, partial [Deltaproteobacteria bacterium]|nr:PAS domain-containing protein [Deltaproteobacteria bacterium]